jgi:hypothetical protein
MLPLAAGSTLATFSPASSSCCTESAPSQRNAEACRSCHPREPGNERPRRAQAMRPQRIDQFRRQGDLPAAVHRLQVRPCALRWRPGSPDMTPTGVRYSLNRTSARFHSPPIIRAGCRRQRRWLLQALAYIPPRRSHPPTAASLAARRSAHEAQAPACRARMNSGT